MAKSLRSKRRQKILGVRRVKYKERELKKIWAKHLSKQSADETLLAETDVKHSGINQLDPTTTIMEGGSTDTPMETVTQAKYSNSQLKKIEKVWGTANSRKKQKTKRLKKKGHSQW